MKHLLKLDLSYNRIEQMDNRLFESNPKLTHLDLSGNKFMSLADHALIKSASLTELVLVDCKLVHISHLMFHAVPNLRILDLSQNLLKSIHIKPLQKIKQLQSVNLEDNSWNCDEETFKVLKWLKKRGVEVRRNQCCKYYVVLPYGSPIIAYIKFLQISRKRVMRPLRRSFTPPQWPLEKRSR